MLEPAGQPQGPHPYEALLECLEVALQELDTLGLWVIGAQLSLAVEEVRSIVQN